MSIEDDRQHPLEHEISAPLLSCRISGASAKPVPPGSIGKWIWLFPLTYAAHIAEEFWGGEGFAAWFSRTTGMRSSDEVVLLLNAIGWVVMTVGVFLVARYRKWRWVLTALGGIVLTNALLHALGSILTRSYSPGMVTGLIFWLPLGLFTLIHEARYAARSTFIKGLIGAAVFNGLAVPVILASR